MNVPLKMMVQWGPSPAGTILEFEAEKAKRIIAAGYAEYAPPEEAKTKERVAPIVEIADAPGPAEEAVVTPQIPRRGPGRPRKDDIAEK